MRIKYNPDIALLLLYTSATVLAIIALPISILSFFGIINLYPPANLSQVLALIIITPIISFIFVTAFREEIRKAKICKVD